VGDFGISKRVINDNTALTTAIGTVGYVAPEVLGFLEKSIEGYTNAIDIWSLGAVVYWILTSEIPFSTPRSLLMYTMDLSQFPSNALSAVDVDEKCCQFLLALIEVQPDKRPTARLASYIEWLKGVESISKVATYKGLIGSPYCNYYH
jgi:serine/threonine protein kinase